MKDFFKKYGLIIFIGVLDVVLVLIIIFLPMREIRSDSRLVTSLKMKWLSLKDREQSFEVLNRDYQESLADITVIENSFISGEEPVEFLNFLEKLIGSLGLSFETDIFVSPKAKQDKWPSMIFQLSGEGEPERMMQFLDKIEHNPYMAEIVNFNLGRSDKTEKGIVTDEKGNLKGDFSIKVYIR